MCLVTAMVLAGCPGERASVDGMEPAAETAARGARPSALGMMVEVASVRSEATIDAEGVRLLLHDAESAFLTCLDPDGSTGVIALKISVEGDGATLEAATQPATTYGTDDARACFERIVASLRFPTTQAQDRFELAVSLEVRPRYEGETSGGL